MKSHRNNKFFSIISLIIIIAFTIAACGSTEVKRAEAPAKQDNTNQGNSNQSEAKKESEPGQTIKVKYADIFPTSHSISKYGSVPWMERVEELTNGKVQFEYYPAEQLGKAQSMLDTAKNKVTDIAFIGPLYSSDKLPLSGVIANPGLIPDAVVGTKAYWKLTEEVLYEKELKAHRVKPLWVMVSSPYQITTSKKKVEVIEDMKGLKLRTSGGAQEKLAAMVGAAPVSIPGPEIFQSLERGTIDATLISLVSWGGYQLNKVLKYSSTNAALSTFPYIVAVNEEVWNSWPEDVQKAMVQSSNEIMETFPETNMKLESEWMKQYKDENGVEFYEIDKAELERWNKIFFPISNEWAKELDAKGLAGTEVLNAIQKYADEFGK